MTAYCRTRSAPYCNRQKRDVLPARLLIICVTVLRVIGTSEAAVGFGGCPAQTHHRNACRSADKRTYDKAYHCTSPLGVSMRSREGIYSVYQSEETEMKNSTSPKAKATGMQNA